MFPEERDGGARRRPRLQRRPSARRDPLRRTRASRTRRRTRRRRRSSAPSRRPGSRTGCVRPTATWKVWGNSLGTLDWRADPQNLPAGLTEPWPARLRHPRRRRPRQRLRRARRDLRPRARRGDHRLRDRLGRPPQLLGGLCREGASAQGVRAGRASASSAARSPARARWRPTSTGSPRTIRCGRSSSPTGPTAPSPTGRSTCC